MTRWAVSLAAIVVLLLAGATVLVGWGMREMNRPGPLAAETTVIVPRGSGVLAIAERLQTAGAVRHARLFAIGLRVMGVDRELKAGEYLIPARISARDLALLLREGKTVARKLTVAEGLTTQDALDLVRAAEGLEGDISLAPDEGALLPETYHYAWGDSRDDVVARMGQAMQEALAELWPRRAANLPLKTPEEAVILASIVERETSLPEERARIAAVFLNRLRKGMRLQADPTLVYGLSNGSGSIGRPLSKTDLKQATPYNTYLHDGLPPGPIANPGRAALAAVLDPAPTKDLYFVADGSGGHAFAETLAQHNRNVAKWRKLLRQQKRQQNAAQ
jgi:UPF0755 protein